MRHSSDHGCSYRSGGTAATAWTKKSDAALNAATAGVSIVPFLAPRRAMWWIYGSDESGAANVAEYGIAAAAHHPDFACAYEIALAPERRRSSEQ